MPLPSTCSLASDIQGEGLGFTPPTEGSHSAKIFGQNFYSQLVLLSLLPQIAEVCLAIQETYALTRLTCVIIHRNAPKCVWRPGSVRTRCGSLQRSPEPLAGFTGKGGEGMREKGEGKEGAKGKREGEGRGKGREREGEGGPPQEPVAPLSPPNSGTLAPWSRHWT